MRSTIGCNILPPLFPPNIPMQLLLDVRPSEIAVNTESGCSLVKWSYIPREHVTVLLNDLHGLPGNSQVEFKLLILTYTAVNGLRSGYLRRCLSPLQYYHGCDQQTHSSYGQPPLVFSLHRVVSIMKSLRLDALTNLPQKTPLPSTFPHLKTTKIIL